MKIKQPMISSSFLNHKVSPSIKSIFFRLNRFFLRVPLPKQILFFYILSWLFTIVFLPVMVLGADILGKSDDGPTTSNWFLVILLVPFLETAISQYLPFKLLNIISFFKNKQGLIILLAALVFGVFHLYNLGYAFFGFSMGLVLSYIYYFYHHNPKKAFWVTCLIHSLRNLTAFGIMLISDFKF
ncbi:CPBP family intramembrane glutamic endopeptidase [Pedobacter cryophilus]|uniref:CPBP family intramembrane metalloprotease n=1 Tax=Pedobacter cryophilus TaxID=2571271 RepID=A0A4U1BUI5_9SPHI|nr:CPBP family intramembrane glutamic endopeptidase [Pedobacter cryophilus]TKB96308.1 CPBP family intramembrane metalloprotease [Pedobacter cryophilus]